MKNKINRLVLLGLLALLVAGISACAKPPKAELSVSKTQIKQGESVSVNWKTLNAKETVLNGEKVSQTGTKLFQPDQTTTYSLLGRSGKKEAKDAKTVTVEVLPAGPAITFTSDPGAITTGDKATLRWTTQRAESVEIPGLGKFGPSGQTEVTPFQSITYTATARGAGGEASASARVTVTAKADNTGNNASSDGYREDVAKDFERNVLPIYFDFDKSDLREDAKSTLNNSASYLLKENFKTVKFRVEGNCDPRGSEEYNLALGDRRGNEAKTYLVSKGIDPGRMDVVSNGKRTAQGTSEGSPSVKPSWAHDRRADFVYLSGGSITLKPAPAE